MVGSLIGAPHLFAWRPSGKLLRMNERSRIEDVTSGKAHPFVPTVNDMLANDWEVGPLSKVRAFFNKAAGQGDQA